jgi:acetyl-CoA carboxylase/biotin carboxylase 1
MTEISAGAHEGANGRSVPYVNGKASYAEKFNIADHFIGGNRVENAAPSKVKDFVVQNGGHTVITNVRSPFCEFRGSHSGISTPPNSPW